ncbi:MAG TPA: hypothetical protein VNL37_08315, partial [Candidatus Polarisedimenticolia bacterium]|nr:hypothetical protein [Candidatus Polarisedimenticolia bacterium]
SSPAVARWPAAETPLLAPLSPQPLGVNFKAISLRSPHESSFIPPDTVGDVGPTQILAAANGRIKVFDRTGAMGGLNADIDLFFASVDGGVGITDPQVRYDRLSGRWFVTAVTVDTPNTIVLAVSSGPTIAGSTSFSFFGFQQDLVGPTPNSDTGGFADYDSLGVDRFALYIGTNTFNGSGTSFLGATGFVVNKADLLAGTLTVTAFRQMAGPSTSTPGPYSPRGVDNDDPAATQGFFIGVDSVAFGLLDLRRISNPGGTPSISGNLFLTVPTTTYPALVPHLGMATKRRRLDALDDRLFAARIHRDKLTGVSSLWTAHSIQVDGAGVASNSGGRDGARWYEIRGLDATPTLFQAGTLFDPASSDPRFFWIPTVAMSGQGHAALGSSTAGSLFGADVSVAGRFASDPAGTMQGFTAATATATSYNVQSVDGQRWGDYSATVVDPLDDMTLWTFQEYCDDTDSWGVQVVQLLAPPPATPSGVSPSAVCVGAPSVFVTVTGSVIGGSGFFDPGPDTGGPGFHRLAASVGGGVAVNGVTFDSPTQIRLDLSTTAATLGSQDVTVTNPDGQSRTAPALLGVTSRPAPPAASNNGPICAGGTLQLSASTVSGAAYTWTGPNGFTSTEQNPILPGAGAAASGDYAVTVTTGGGCASDPAVTTVLVVPEGGACDDGVACTTVDTCQAGICVGGVPRDADQDLHGDASCGGDDCNDADPLVWHAPIEVSGLLLTGVGPSDLSWDDQGPAVGPETVYDLASGSIDPVVGIDFPSGVCLQSGGGAAFSDTRADPPAGEGFWYLARGRNGCGAGT